MKLRVNLSPILDGCTACNAIMLNRRVYVIFLKAVVILQLGKYKYTMEDCHDRLSINFLSI